MKPARSTAEITHHRRRLGICEAERAKAVALVRGTASSCEAAALAGIEIAFDAAGARRLAELLELLADLLEDGAGVADAHPPENTPERGAVRLEARPCLYCNSTQAGVRTIGGGALRQVACMACQARGPEMDDRDAAVLAWNFACVATAAFVAPLADPPALRSPPEPG
ncbi:hypothetical protein [Bradyrhizobium sp. CCBAU 11357]|uniref:hypothetical protein n=1 Tax=Bradyrhizobium sp. CCBAU 11357 TaxID=1630808 RepID=UPI0023038DCC|nr:hypothetical protein [Bradyrhizobium sp. CCBAU 11357]MDA9499307.1 hypothetical protein [Bradyrhizobium sp. CCBAU 11357]